MPTERPHGNSQFYKYIYMTSRTRRAFENGLDLLQSLAFGFGDEEYCEDDVEGAHAGEEPEGSCAG